MRVRDVAGEQALPKFSRGQSAGDASMCGAPSMFIAHEPQIPSRHERRKVRVGSSSFLILISASRTCGARAGEPPRSPVPAKSAGAERQSPHARR